MARQPCPECLHRIRMRLWQLTARHPGHSHLLDIEKKVRCSGCGYRIGNRIYVTIADRD
jgi:DNA-directed RNA polymerase subunit RPC12/RpoP